MTDPESSSAAPHPRAIYTGCTDGTLYESVFFERDSSVLDADEEAALDRNVELFRECPLDSFHVRGMAANGERRPRALAQARALVVAEYYISQGISAERLRLGRAVAAGCRLCSWWRATETFAAID